MGPYYDEVLQENLYDRFRFPFEAVRPGARVVIYGGGVVGKMFLRQVARGSYCTLVGICDQNPGATGIVELPVFPVARLAGLSQDAYDVVLIAIEKREIAREIWEDLRMAGIPENKLRWVNPANKAGAPISAPPGRADTPVSAPSGRAEHAPVRQFEFAPDPRFEFPWREVPEGCRLVIYGGGVVGKTFLAQVLPKGTVDVLAVCDRNPSGTGIRSLPVITLAQLGRLQKDSYDMVLVANEREDIADDIIDDLLQEGIPSGKIKWHDPAKR